MFVGALRIFIVMSRDKFILFGSIIVNCLPVWLVYSYTHRPVDSFNNKDDMSSEIMAQYNELVRWVIDYIHIKKHKIELMPTSEECTNNYHVD